MIRELTLGNFKPFGRSQVAPFAPITLIYGPNSGGKSSIIQSLLLLKQSVIHGPGHTSLVTSGEFGDFGNIKSLLHGHDLSKEMLISVSFDFSRKDNSPDLDPETPRLVELTFGHVSGEHLQQGIAGELVRSRAVLQSPSGFDVEVSRRPAKELIIKNNLDGEGYHDGCEWSCDASRKSLARYLASHHGGGGKLEDFESILDSVSMVPFLFVPCMLDNSEERGVEAGSKEERAQASRVLQVLAYEFFRIIGKVRYLGPLRVYPSRHTLIKGLEKDTVGSRGEDVIDVLHRHRTDLLGRINYWLSQFEYPYEVRIQSFGDEVTGEIATMYLNDKKNQIEVSPADVGFGMCQLLPIVVEGLIASGSSICVEQPEIHLHPRLQAHVADFLIASAGLIPPSERMGSDCTEEGNQWIIETHSEALMLRLQRRIREGRILPRDISVLYVDACADGSNIRRLRLDDDGEFIDEWPSGFFEESYREIFESDCK